MTHANKFRPWFVLAGLVGVQAGFMGIGVNCISIIFTAVIKDMNFSAGAFSIYYTISALVSALSVRLLTKIFLRFNGKWILAGMGLIAACSIGAMSLFTEIWHWYIAAAASGFAACLCPIAVPIIINNWFDKRKGMVNGIVMAASGLAGVIFAPVCSVLIERAGWRSAVLLLMAALLVLVCFSSLFLVHVSPKGAVSYNPDEDIQSTGNNIISRKPDLNPKNSFAVFILLLLSLLIPRFFLQFCVQLPMYASSLGYSTTIIGILTSVLMCGNIIGKVLFGAVLDKVGVYHATCGIYALLAVAFFFFFTAAHIPLFVFISAFLIGGTYSLYTVGASMLFLDLYGSENYKEQMAKFFALTTILSAFAGPIIAFSYDLFGTYNVVILLGALGSIAMATATIALKNTKSRRYTNKLHMAIIDKKEY